MPDAAFSLSASIEIDGSPLADELGAAPGARPRRRLPPPAGHVRARLPRPRADRPPAGSSQDRLSGQDRGDRPREPPARRPDHGRGHRDRGRVRAGRQPGDRPRLRPLASAPPRPADRDLPQRHGLRHRPHGRAARGVADRHDRRHGPTQEHVSQANTSDWDFLAGRAREIGFEMSVEEGKFSFRRPTPSAEGPGGGDFTTENPTQLVLGQELLEFLPRVTSSEQVKEVQVRGWDPLAKKALVGSAAAGASSARLPAMPTSLADAFGDPVYVATDRPLANQAEVDAAASDRRADRQHVRRGRGHRRAATPSSSRAPGQRWGRRRGLRRPVHAHPVPARLRRRRVPDAVRRQRPPGALPARARRWERSGERARRR